MQTVQHWMSSPAIVVPATTTLPAAREQMRLADVRRLVVVDARGQLAGIVTAGAIDRVSGDPAHDLRDYNVYHRVCDVPIGAIMARQVITVTPETPMCEVAQLLLARRINGAPVLAGDQVVGVISVSDLLRMLAWDAGGRN